MLDHTLENFKFVFREEYVNMKEYNCWFWVQEQLLETLCSMSNVINKTELVVEQNN